MDEILFLGSLAFLAGLVDSVAGGGGLIQVPALLAFMPTAPVSVVLGTNKISSIAGTAVAALRFGWSVPVAWRVVVPAALAAGLSAGLGAKLATSVDNSFLKPLVVILLIVVLLQSLFTRNFGVSSERILREEKRGLGLVVFASVVGFYDGFLGPGAGSMLMFGLIRGFRYNFLSAAATTKVLNLATNFGALTLFVATDNVAYVVGLPMAVMNILGSSLGAHVAVRGGNRLIRVVFLVVVVALIAKIIGDLIDTGFT